MEVGREIQEGGDLGITGGEFMLMCDRDQTNTVIINQLKIKKKFF